MMEWAIVILLGAAVVLLILSVSISKKESEKQQNDNEMLTASMMKEVSDLQEQIRKLELDLEIIAEEANLKSTEEDRLLMREVLDLHRRKYSLGTIAAKTSLTEDELERMIAPFKKAKVKRGNLTDDES